MIREYSNFETEHNSAFHKVLMKYIEIVTNYILDFNSINIVFNYAIYSMYFDRLLDNMGNNKITEPRAILQRESKNSLVYKQTKSVTNRKTVKTVMTLTSNQVLLIY